MATEKVVTCRTTPTSPGRPESVADAIPDEALGARPAPRHDRVRAERKGPTVVREGGALGAEPGAVVPLIVKNLAVATITTIPATTYAMSPVEVAPIPWRAARSTTPGSRG